MAGGLVLFQLPAFLASSPNYLFTSEVFASWQVFISVISGALSVFWLILNNFWFNVVMVMLFNELVISQKNPAAPKSHYLSILQSQHRFTIQ